MVFFHIYVSLPEGRGYAFVDVEDLTCLKRPTYFTSPVLRPPDYSCCLKTQTLYISIFNYIMLYPPCYYYYYAIVPCYIPRQPSLKGC